MGGEEKWVLSPGGGRRSWASGKNRLYHKRLGSLYDTGRCGICPVSFVRVIFAIGHWDMKLTELWLKEGRRGDTFLQNPPLSASAALRGGVLGTASWTSSSLAGDPARGRSSNAPLSPENQVTPAALSPFPPLRGSGLDFRSLLLDLKQKKQNKTKSNPTPHEGSL